MSNKTLDLAEKLKTIDDGSLIVVDDGHHYVIKNRGGGYQEIKFAKITDGELQSGLFSQDLAAVLAHRIDAQLRLTPQKHDQCRRRAKQSAESIVRDYEEFTERRYLDECALLGHTQAEFDKLKKLKESK